MAIQAAPNTKYPKATQPTFYFFGVTTDASSIVRVFPRWAEYLKLGDALLQGIDCRRHDDPAVYRHAVEFIKSDPLSKGALVTTHKVDLFKASRELFDFVDAYADATKEISCISKREGRLRGHAKDPVTGGLALEAFLPPGHWQVTGAEVFVIGAGGAATAITSYLLASRHGANRPARIVVSNRSAARLDELKSIHERLGVSTPVEYRPAPRPEDNDRIMEGLKPQSLVINATGLGKDAPGSPITSAAKFPRRGFAWDTNYRGALVFLDQARAREKACELTIRDGWDYFVHGWTRAIAEVFEVEIPVVGPRFAELSRIAQEAR